MEKVTKIKMPTIIGLQLINPTQINSIYSENRKSIVYLDDGTKIIAYKGIEEMENLLDQALFFRCHRSYIINLSKILTVNNGFKSLYLCCGTEIPISKYKKKDLKQVLDKFWN